MTSLEQIQQELQTLPPEALTLVAQFIQLLRKSFSTSQASENISTQTTQAPQKSTYEQFEDSGLIGCISVEAELSSNYKAVLTEEYGRKYDHR